MSWLGSFAREFTAYMASYGDRCLEVDAIDNGKIVSELEIKPSLGELIGKLIRKAWRQIRKYLQRKNWRQNWANSFLI